MQTQVEYSFKQQQWINGQWLDGDGESFTSLRPYDQTLLWQGQSATEQQVLAAVASAREAFYEWKHTEFSEREAYIQAYAKLLEAHQVDIATLISMETGKPFWESKTEAAAMLSKVKFSIQSYQERSGEKCEQRGSYQIQLQHKPIGVLAVFGPYNFPCHLPNGHIIPALLAGNTVVFKPSEQTPATGEFMISLWEQAGLPHGVLNLIQGGKETGSHLSKAQQLDGILFTGSAATGRLLHQQLGGQVGKMLALEMGGNNPMIIDKEYGDLDACVLTVIQSAFLSAGQRCTCARRLFIANDEAGDKLLVALIKTVSSLKYGAPLEDEQPFMGALISPSAAKAIIDAQDQLIELGGNALLKAKLVPPSFVTPSLIDVTDLTHVPDDEYFGPLLQIYRYQEFSQAVDLANQTQFGLSAGLVSVDKMNWEYFQDRIRAGVVNWNRPLTGASGDLPFGGVGQSGNFRASAYYAADYCAYPMASVMGEVLESPSQIPPGIRS